MSRSPSKRISTFPKFVIAMTVAVLPLVACSDGGDDGDDPPAASTTSTTEALGVTATVDWTSRTATVTGTDLGVAFCEGEAPLLCITSPEGGSLGVIEHAEFEPVPDLDAFAADFAASMETDRTEHCNPSFELEPDETTPTTLFGEDGVRYGYTGTVAGELVERVVGHAAIVDDRLHLVVANFLADDGCLARESELPIAMVDDVEPILDAVAAGSTR